MMSGSSPLFLSRLLTSSPITVSHLCYRFPPSPEIQTRSLPTVCLQHRDRGCVYPCSFLPFLQRVDVVIAVFSLYLLRIQSRASLDCTQRRVPRRGDVQSLRGYLRRSFALFCSLSPCFSSTLR